MQATFRRVSRLGENTGGVQLFLAGDISAKVPIFTPDVLRFNDFFGTERGNVTSTACGRKVTALPRMSCLTAPSCALSLGTHLAQKLRAVNLIRVFAFVRCALRLDLVVLAFPCSCLTRPLGCVLLKLLLAWAAGVLAEPLIESSRDVSR